MQLPALGCQYIPNWQAGSRFITRYYSLGTGIFTTSPEHDNLVSLHGVVSQEMLIYYCIIRPKKNDNDHSFLRKVCVRYCKMCHTKCSHQPGKHTVHLPHPEWGRTNNSERQAFGKRTNKRGNLAILSTVRLCGGEECNWFEQAAASEQNPNRVMRHRRLNETLAKVREE